MIFKEKTRSGFSKLLQTVSENHSRISEWNVEQLSPQVSLLLTRYNPFLTDKLRVIFRRATRHLYTNVILFFRNEMEK